MQTILQICPPSRVNVGGFCLFSCGECFTSVNTCMNAKHWDCCHLSAHTLLVIITDFHLEGMSGTAKGQGHTEEWCLVRSWTGVCCFWVKLGGYFHSQGKYTQTQQRKLKKTNLLAYMRFSKLSLKVYPLFPIVINSVAFFLEVINSLLETKYISFTQN